MNIRRSYSGSRALRALLPLVMLLCFAGGAAQSQGGFPPGYWSGPRYNAPQYFQPPPLGSVRRAKPKPVVSVQIPTPENVTISEEYAKGSIVIVNHERTLYFVEEQGKAIRYPVAIGSPADEWEGVQKITAKRENPTWYPPIDIQIETDIPPVVPPGPHNPLGPRALYLGDTLYRIHGTNRPGSIGGAVSHGCFRMFNPHVVELYEKVDVGASVYVVP